MEEIKITNKATEKQIKEYASKNKISFQKACELIFKMGVCHLQKKDDNFQSNKITFIKSGGVCHRHRLIRRTTIIEEFSLTEKRKYERRT